MKEGDLLNSIGKVESLTNVRLDRYPQSSFFSFAARQTASIRERWEKADRFDMSFYNQLNIGLMCARELEQVDPEFCDAVYNMLGLIRLDATTN